MRNNKRIIILAILSLMLCISLIIGATFALFTSESKTNIAINSGKVELIATLGSLTLYSPSEINADGTIPEDATNAATQTHFVNGGSAEIDGNTLKLNLMAPGDKVEFVITLENKSSIAIKYQTIISNLADNDLFAGLNVTINGKKYSGNEIRSEWWSLKAGEKITDNKIKVSIELPADAGKEYYNASTEITIAVRAVQRNTNVAVPVLDVSEFINAVQSIENNGTISIAGDMTITGSNGGDLKDTGKTTNVNLNGNTVTGSTGNAAFGVRNNAIVNFSNGTVIADADTYTAVLSRYEGAVANVLNMTLSNIKLNGTALASRDGAVINVEGTTINSTIGGCADANGGTINIKDCTFNQTGEYVDLRSALIVICGEGTVNIQSGTFIGDSMGLHIFTSGGTFNVYGGYFRADEVLRGDWTDEGTQSVFNIYGGEFDGKININGVDRNIVNIEAGTFTNTGLSEEQFAKYVAEGSTLTVSGGTYIVTPGK